MPRISIRPDGRGGRAVFSDRTLLMAGLGADEARTFAAFFRAADRLRTGPFGSLPLSAGPPPQAPERDRPAMRRACLSTSWNRQPTEPVGLVRRGDGISARSP